MPLGIKKHSYQVDCFKDSTLTSQEPANSRSWRHSFLGMCRFEQHRSAELTLSCRDLHLLPKVDITVVILLAGLPLFISLEQIKSWAERLDGVWPHITLSSSQFLGCIKTEVYLCLSYIGATVKGEIRCSGLFEECQAVFQRNYNI